MRFFDLLDFQYVVILISMGLIALLLLYVAIGGYAFPPKGKEMKGRGEIKEVPGGIQTEKNPIPLILIFIYIGLAVWAIGYVIVIGIKGGPF